MIVGILSVIIVGTFRRQPFIMLICCIISIMKQKTKALKAQIIIAIIIIVLALATTVAITILGDNNTLETKPAVSDSTTEPDSDDDSTARDSDDDSTARDSDVDDSNKEQADNSESPPECDLPISQLESIEGLITYLGCPNASQSDRENVWETFILTYGTQEECWNSGLESPFTLNDIESVFGNLQIALFDSRFDDLKVDQATKVFAEKMQSHIDSGGSKICVYDFLNLLEIPVLRRANRNTQRQNDLATLRSQMTNWISDRNGRMPESLDDLRKIVNSVDWQYYNGDNPQPLSSVADDGTANSPGEFKIHMITDSGNTTQTDLDIDIANLYLPGRRELHIWLAKRCGSEMLAGGNDKDITTISDTKYATGDILLSSKRSIAFVYQREIYQLVGKGKAHCEDNT